jgi:starch phosphorylase
VGHSEKEARIPASSRDGLVLWLGIQLRAQEAVSLAWTDRMHWNRMSLLNTARTGFFSSDRSIAEYCQNIWNVEALNVEITCDVR